jgi:hypothetical protein
MIFIQRKRVSLKHRKLNQLIYPDVFDHVCAQTNKCCFPKAKNDGWMDSILSYGRHLTNPVS